jgi:lipopolysaccharide export system protein LptA
MSKQYSSKNPRPAVFFLGFSLCLFFLSYPSFSRAEDRLIENRGPITVTSSRLTADNKAHTALFEGSVVAKTETMTIYSDKMLVYYSEAGKVTKIDVDGHVKLIKGERVITSDAATYFADDQERVIFTGQPKAVEGNNVVTGTKMIYLMKEDRYFVDNSKVFMEKGSAVKR